MILRTTVLAALLAIFSAVSANWFDGFGNSTVKSNTTNISSKPDSHTFIGVNALRKGRQFAYIDTKTTSVNSLNTPNNATNFNIKKNTWGIDNTKAKANGRIDYTVSSKGKAHFDNNSQRAIADEAYAKGFAAGLAKGRNPTPSHKTYSNKISANTISRNKKSRNKTGNAWANIEEKNARFYEATSQQKSGYAPANFDPVSIDSKVVYPSDLNLEMFK